MSNKEAHSSYHIYKEGKEEGRSTEVVTVLQDIRNVAVGEVEQARQSHLSYGKKKIEIESFNRVT